MRGRKLQRVPTFYLVCWIFLFGYWILDRFDPLVIEGLFDLIRVFCRNL